MNFNFNGEIWEIALLIFGAALTYGAGFLSEKLVTEDDEKRVRTKIALKVVGFAFVAIAAISVMFIK